MISRDYGNLGCGATEFVSITILIMVSAPSGLVAALSIVVIVFGHLGGAGLVSRRFELLCRVLVTKLATFRISCFGSWSRCQVVSHLANRRLTFTAVVAVHKLR